LPKATTTGSVTTISKMTYRRGNLWHSVYYNYRCLSCSLWSYSYCFKHRQWTWHTHCCYHCVWCNYSVLSFK